MNKVKVIFEDSAHNYTTNVSAQTTEADARAYFVGTLFNIGSFPIENLQKCIDIVFYPKKLKSYDELTTEEKEKFNKECREVLDPIKNQMNEYKSQPVKYSKLFYDYKSKVNELREKHGLIKQI